jgi:diguanylate cyclase (GGDEF)-like protein
MMNSAESESHFRRLLRSLGLNAANMRDRLPADQRVKARAAAFLWAGGALLVYTSVLLRPAPGTFIPGMLTIATLAVVTAALLLWLGERSPEWLFHGLLVIGTALVTTLTVFDGARASAFAFLYIWVALWVYNFFPLRAALAHTVVVGVACALSLALKGVDAGFVRWSVIVGTLAISGLLTNRLVRLATALALTDPLTKVANRRRFDDELSGVMARARRDGTATSVAIFDLDHFKQFNDDMGHHLGDRHLELTARSWASLLRPGDLLARYGGEEFALVLPQTGSQRALEVVQRLRAVTPHGQTASAGVATWNGEETAQAVLDRADAALYEAKVAGRDRAILAAEEQRSAADINLPQVWARLLPEVLENHTMTAVFQPLVRLSDETVIGYEALARPAADGSPTLSVEGLFSAAQRMGLGRDLDWLCRRACLDAARRLPPSVDLLLNISVPAFMAAVHPVDQLLMLAEWAEREPSSMILEITERDLVADLEPFQAQLRAYRRHGFRFAIDDIGDGHSTLEVLAAAEPEYVKVARKLVHAVDERSSRAAISAIVAFALVSGSQVIAEGIETSHQRFIVEELGVQLGQGWALGKPDALDSWLERGLRAV